MTQLFISDITIIGRSTKRTKTKVTHTEHKIFLEKYPVLLKDMELPSQEYKDQLVRKHLQKENLSAVEVKLENIIFSSKILHNDF